MSTNDVPGAKASNNDILAMGCWAEHEDGSLIVVESVEAGSVVYSIFDIGVSPRVEYRDAMKESTFKDQFTWKSSGKGSKKSDNLKWTWHDKTPFPWDKVMEDYPSGEKSIRADDLLSAASKVAESLDLRAEAVRDRHNVMPTIQKAATEIMGTIHRALESLKK